ncbi:hypothetical protein J53TS2_33980 [Paenibacillus sp. J53TS2]|uniref:hypothetical protein n=1 Tax=Paenibacillus sp. J53TS2 TaxID=2807197 RepID=UPI001B2E2431|nr:hypothetical protein [Paenibacillus sp. J53TS2]GIP49807.1 hypothetical protein J53TS2_33980 [Paenibacillus sp. J53TS2]
MRRMCLKESGKGWGAGEWRVELLIWRWNNIKRCGGGWGVGARAVDGEINANGTERRYFSF